MNTATQSFLSPYHRILKVGNYVDGKWFTESTTDELKVFDKYSNEELAALPLADEKVAEEAIEAAGRGFDALSKWSAGKKSDALYKLAELLLANKEAFVDLIVREAGKPVSYAENEIERCITTVKTAATEALRLSGEVVPIDYGAGEGKTAFTKRFPVGIVLCITPFNFPMNLVLHKVAPALACGCSVIVKPAPQSPLCTMALASLIEMAGFPKGVFNSLVCDIPVAEKMVRDNRIAMLSFTGSEKVGWYLKSICGKKKVTLELGGNASVIIDETADLNAAAPAVARGAFLYAGQVCISTQRVFVEASVFDKFSNLLISEISKLESGDPGNANVTVGPLIDRSHFERIKTWVAEALEGGAEVLYGAKVFDNDHNIFEPTLLTNTSSSMKVSCAEVFGPVALIEKVSSFEEGIARTNDSVFGLQTGVYTNRFDRVKMAHEELEVGGIIINNIPGFRIDSMPYGGIKDSGLGREGVEYAMEEMTESRLLIY